jgi:hypothetical protein
MLNRTPLPPSRLRQLAKITLFLALLTAILSGTFLVKELLPEKVQTAAAQGEEVDSFSSGSNGSDGAFTLNEPGTYIFDHVNFPFDPDGDYVYHFTTITIGTGVTLILRSPNMTAPVYWLATGDVQIDGIIDLNGQDGQNYTTITNCGARFSALPGAGGFGGGLGKCGTANPAQQGKGPGGGYVNINNPYTGGGGGHKLFGGGAGGPAYGNDFLVPLIGGSGGGGGSSNNNSASGEGGGGGGALLIASPGSIIINGVIRANGGKGGNNYNSGGNLGSGAGGGSGGNIHLLASTLNVSGSILTQGGSGGSGYGNGGTGSVGRIRLEAFTYSLTGSTINPGAILGTPFNVYLPTTPPPSASVIEVDGVPLTDFPTGSYATPDLTINTPANSVFTIEARYIPLGTTVELHIVSEDGVDQIVTSTPLAGTFELSTATVTATVPTGFSRFFVVSDWTP